MRSCLFTLMVLVSHTFLFAQTTEPFSNISADRRESLSTRIIGYVEAYKTRNWERLYNFVSDVGKGRSNQKAFVAAMQASHGKSFALMPNIRKFTPDRAKSNGDGYDIYGCGKVELEGGNYEGITVVHAVLEHNDWFFTGWRFTEFPYEPCKALVDPKWKPRNELAWKRPMAELPNFEELDLPPIWVVE
jgi:hypothetical protein